MSEWHYMSGDQQCGPVSGSQLKAMAAGGALKPDDLVWNQALPDWTQASKVRGLVFPKIGAAAPRVTAAPVMPTAAPAPAAAPEYEQQYAEQPEQGYAETAPQEAAPVSYASPTTGDATPVSRGVIDVLTRSVMWVRIISIFMFVSAGIVALVGLGLGLLALVAAFHAGSHAGLALIIGLVLLVVYVGLGALAFFPALFLMRSAGHITHLQRSGVSQDLENAVDALRSYFKFNGILLLVMAAVGLLSLLGNMMRLM